MTEGARHAHVIRRPRVLRALAGGGGSPLRLLCAPIGSGITTALRDYAACEPGVTVLSASSMQTADDVRKALRGCAGAREVLIDDADRLTRDAFDAVLAFSLRARAPRLLLAGHARSRLRVHTLVASGDAELLDAGALAFEPAETAQIAAALGVDADASDIAEMLHQTDGWPVVVSWVMRDAARERRSLCGAFDVWADANGHLLREFIDAAIGEDGVSEAVALERVCAAPSYDDVQSELARLDLCGYPVVRTRQGLRPYHVLRRIAIRLNESRRAESGGRLVLTLLGQFSARAGDRSIAFMRRRDRNVLIYLALAPGGTVSRADLASIFWPGVTPAISSQGIRTTLSRLRHAIATASGHDAEQYLRSGALVALDLDHVSVDARRFTEHATQGRLAEERGDVAGAYHHYVFAERFRGADLLRSEAVEPALEPFVERYRQLAAEVAERLSIVRAECARSARTAGDAVSPRLHAATA